MSRFTGVLIEKDTGYGRKEEYVVREEIVVDRDTGEIMLRRPSVNIGKVFSEGTSAFAAVVMVGREVLDDGREHITISSFDTGDVMFQFWRNPIRGVCSSKPKHTGGKRGYVKWYDDAADELFDRLDYQNAGVLWKLSRFVDWGSGVLVDRRTKKPLDNKRLCKLLGFSAKTLGRRIAALSEHGVLSCLEDGSYRMNRNLIARG